MTAPALRRLLRDSAGVALVEFAFAAPIFLTLILGGLELTNLALAHLRVSQIAMTVADDAGRVATGIDEANIYELFAGAEVIGRSMDFERNGRIVLSSLESNGRSGGDAGQMIRWQRCWGDGDFAPAYGTQGTGENNAELAQGMGPAGNRVTSLPDTAVMFAEVTYVYQPLIATGFFDPPTIRYESAFNVRGRQNNVISNTQSLARFTCG